MGLGCSSHVGARRPWQEGWRQGGALEQCSPAPAGRLYWSAPAGSRVSRMSQGPPTVASFSSVPGPACCATLRESLHGAR